MKSGRRVFVKTVSLVFHPILAASISRLHGLDWIKDVFFFWESLSLMWKSSPHYDYAPAMSNYGGGELMVICSVGFILELFLCGSEMFLIWVDFPYMFVVSPTCRGETGNVWLISCQLMLWTPDFLAAFKPMLWLFPLCMDSAVSCLKLLTSGLK